MYMHIILYAQCSCTHSISILNTIISVDNVIYHRFPTWMLSSSWWALRRSKEALLIVKAVRERWGKSGQKNTKEI